MDENRIPIVAIVVIFGLPIGGWILMRILAHRERMAMIQYGMGPGRPPFEPVRHAPEAADESLRRGIKTTMVGLAILIGLSFIGFRHGPFGMPVIEPGPWLLGGLIPTFIGVAQIIVAVLSGASIGGRRGPSQWSSQPPPPEATVVPPATRAPIIPFEQKK